jgi:hypothetical protein
MNSLHPTSQHLTGVFLPESRIDIALAFQPFESSLETAA